MDNLFNDIQDILIEKLPRNNSGGEVNLSIGEMLLLVINSCEKENIDIHLLAKLKRMYLDGIVSEEDQEFIQKITLILLSKNFSVKADPKTINNDPTRRYFETNLAYYILQNSAPLLETSQLETFTYQVKQRLFSLIKMDFITRIKIEKILKGDMDNTLLDKYQLEYAELIHKLLKQDYYGLSEEACKNLYFIACNTILATIYTQTDKSMPVDIYKDSIFTMGMDGRGRIINKQHNDVKTTSKGLMKSTSPLPQYNDLVNPVETDYCQEAFSPFQRSADQARFMIESGWSQHLFSRQTQLYSNGISSTTLAQIRTIILQKRLGYSSFNQNFQEYIPVFAALMLYNSGGHSFFEIFEVLKLPLCQELFIENDSSSSSSETHSFMSKALFDNHQVPFETALQATQAYAQTILNKKILNAQVKTKVVLNDEPVINKALLQSIHYAVLHNSPEELDELLNNTSEVIDIANYHHWSPLMVAAQLGKNEHVRLLLNAGANINQQVDDFSPLILAIKNQQFTTVRLLLEEGALAKLNGKFSAVAKTKSLVLYSACRQNNLRILDALINQDTWTVDQKKKAILIALKIENFDAVRLLINHLTIADFSEGYKSLLLKQAVTLGNTNLIDNVIRLDIFSKTPIDYNQLLQVSALKGFLPTAKHLLNLANHVENGYSSINLNEALNIALKNHHFDMAVFLIIYGADPQSISTNSCYLQSFNAYLQQGCQHFNLIFTEEDTAKIEERVTALQLIISDKENKVLHGFIVNLVNFMNKILPKMLQFNYNDKIYAMGNIATLFSKNDSQGTLPEIDIASINHSR